MAFDRKEYYRKNRDKLRAEANGNTARRRKRYHFLFVNFIVGRSCECGIDDVRVLTFDHTDPSNKSYNVSDIVSNGLKLEHLIDEVQKCRILCHNCHMLNTFRQIGGSFHDRIAPISKKEFIERYLQK